MGTPPAVCLLEVQRQELKISVVRFPPGELVGSLVLLAGSVNCDELNSKLVGGSPNLQSYCRQDGLATAQVVDLCFGDLVVGLHEQDLVPKLRGCCLKSK